MLLFECAIPGPPVSAQAHRGAARERYREKVATAAKAASYPEQSVITGPVAVTITHFFEGAPADLDNIAKLILDGLKRVVLDDDAQVSDLVIQRRPAQGPYIISSPSPILIAALRTGGEFVHIAVASVAPNAELRPYDYP